MVAGSGLPVVALQEGGYAIDAIGANARTFLRGLRGEDG
jgi:acetoin utilization deacetylase AcuC-like enzyme